MTPVANTKKELRCQSQVLAQAALRGSLMEDDQLPTFAEGHQALGHSLQGLSARAAPLHLQCEWCGSTGGMVTPRHTKTPPTLDQVKGTATRTAQITYLRISVP